MSDLSFALVVCMFILSTCGARITIVHKNYEGISLPKVSIPNTPIHEILGLEEKQ